MGLVSAVSSPSESVAQALTNRIYSIFALKYDVW